MENDFIMNRFNCETSLSTITSQLSSNKTLSKTLTNIIETLLKHHCKNHFCSSCNFNCDILLKHLAHVTYEKQNTISTEYYFKGKYIIILKHPFFRKYCLIVNVHYQSDFHVIIFSELKNIENCIKKVKGCLHQKDSIIMETSAHKIIYLLRNISMFRKASSIFCDLLKGKFDNLEKGDVFIIGYERKEKTRLFELKVNAVNDQRSNHFEIAFEVTGIKENGDKKENGQDIPKQNISLDVIWVNKEGPVVVNFVHHFPEGVIVDYFKNLSAGKSLILKQLKEYLENNK